MIDTAPKPATPLQLVTLAEFFKLERRGSQAKMARALNVSRATLSQLASNPEICGSYKLAKRIKAYMECRGYTVDIETIVRTAPEDDAAAEGGEAEA